MPTKKTPKTTVWRLRVPLYVVEKMRRLAAAERRSVTRQAEIVLEEALNDSPQK